MTAQTYDPKEIAKRIYDGMVNGAIADNYDLSEKECIIFIKEIMRDGFNIDPKELVIKQTVKVEIKDD